MNKEIEIRQATVEDLPRIYLMLEPLYNVKRSISFLRWQLFEQIIPTVLYCAFVGDKAVSMFGIQKRILNNGAVCGQASWLNTSSKWQGRGLFSKLGHLAIKHFNDLDVLCVFANEKARDACNRSFGLEVLLNIREKLLNSVNEFQNQNAEIKICKIDNNCVFHNVKNDRAPLVKFNWSPEYKIWRYGYNPNYRYDKVSLETGEYSVVKIYIHPVTAICSGDIVDVECSMIDTTVIRSLITASCNYLRISGAKNIYSWGLEGSGFDSELKSVGFKESGHKSYFCYKALNPKYMSLHDPSMWYVRQADATNY